ncbi:MAG: hypothetical protein WBY12_10355, partial [Hyphomicrobium sp.]
TSLRFARLDADGEAKSHGGQYRGTGRVKGRWNYRLGRGSPGAARLRVHSPDAKPATAARTYTRKNKSEKIKMRAAPFSTKAEKEHGHS